MIIELFINEKCLSLIFLLMPTFEAASLKDFLPGGGRTVLLPATSVLSKLEAAETARAAALRDGLKGTD